MTRHKEKTVYLSGQMTGKPNFNYPAFNEAADELTAAGYAVINPAENFSGDQTRPYAEYMAVAVRQVERADFLAVLPGWQDSKGARLEVTYAQALGKPWYRLDCVADGYPGPKCGGNLSPFTGIVDPFKCDNRAFVPPGEATFNFTVSNDQVDSWMKAFTTVTPAEPTRARVLDEAKRLITGDRNEAYGTPYDNFANTAGLLDAAGFSRGDKEIRPSDVAVIMMLVKLSRLKNDSTRQDTWLDIAGYSACGAEVAEEEAK